MKVLSALVLCFAIAASTRTTATSAGFMVLTGSTDGMVTICAQNEAGEVGEEKTLIACRKPVLGTGKLDRIVSLAMARRECASYTRTGEPGKLAVAVHSNGEA